MPNQPEFTLLYDGKCPICRKEVAWLRWKNTQYRLDFQDIHAEDFDATRFGKTLTELMAEIHGIYPDGRLIKGMPVFRACLSSRRFGMATGAHRMADTETILRLAVRLIRPPPDSFRPSVWRQSL